MRDRKWGGRIIQIQLDQRPQGPVQPEPTTPQPRPACTASRGAGARERAGVTVSTIRRLHRHRHGDGGAGGRVRAKIVADIPTGRLGTPDENRVRRGLPGRRARRLDHQLEPRHQRQRPPSWAACGTVGLAPESRRISRCQRSPTSSAPRILRFSAAAADVAAWPRAGIGPALPARLSGSAAAGTTPCCNPCFRTAPLLRPAPLGCLLNVRDRIIKVPRTAACTTRNLQLSSPSGDAPADRRWRVVRGARCRRPAGPRPGRGAAADPITEHEQDGQADAVTQLLSQLIPLLRRLLQGLHGQLPGALDAGVPGATAAVPASRWAEADRANPWTMLNPADRRNMELWKDFQKNLVGLGQAARPPPPPRDRNSQKR